MPPEVPGQSSAAASGMRSTFQNAGTALSISVFFTLVIAGLAANLPSTLYASLRGAGIPTGVAHHLAGLPPVSSMFGALLGINPIHHLLVQYHALHYLSPAGQRALTGRSFFPHLISAPFHDGLVVVFIAAAAMSAIAALASLARGASAPAAADLTTPDPTTTGATA